MLRSSPWESSLSLCRSLLPEATSSRGATIRATANEVATNLETLLRERDTALQESRDHIGFLITLAEIVQTSSNPINSVRAWLQEAPSPHCPDIQSTLQNALRAQSRDVAFQLIGAHVRQLQAIHQSLEGLDEIGISNTFNESDAA